MVIACLLFASPAGAQGTGESTAIEFRVERSVALKEEPRFDSRTIRVLEAGTLLRGYLLADGEWWKASYDVVGGYVRDSAVDTTGRRGRAVLRARQLISETEAGAARTTLRDSLRALVSERRARREFADAALEAHAEGIRELASDGIFVSLLTARFLLSRRLTSIEKEMVKIEEEEWRHQCSLNPDEVCAPLPGPSWGYALSLENLYESRIDSIWFEVRAFDDEGADIGSFVFRGIGPVGEGVPGGVWVYEPENLPRGTVCAELMELEVEWEDGLVYSYAASDLRIARLPLFARGWPILDVGPVGARFAERSRKAFGLNEIVLKGDCVSP